MFIFVPYRSDVVARQFVWGTVGVIVANIAVAVLLGFPGRRLPEPGDMVLIDHWVLHFGTINPAEWLTSAFTHFSWWHLGFNMVFLWAFGFVVESLLGWQRFLVLYLGLAVAGGCLTQLVMLGTTGGAAGASGAITSLMVIAALWSPRNEMTVFVWFIILIRTAMRTRVLTFCALWIGLQVVFVLLQGFRLSSELLHVFGAVVGLGAGVLMLYEGWVETEGWDLLSLRRGDPRARQRAELRQVLTPVALDHSDAPLRDALIELRDALAEGNPGLAEEAYARGQRADRGWILPQNDLHALIRGLVEEKAYEPAVARMEEYVKAYPEDTVPMRIRLVQGYLATARPTRALEEIARLDGMPLGDKQRALLRRLERHAANESESGRLELE